MNDSHLASAHSESIMSMHARNHGREIGTLMLDEIRPFDAVRALQVGLERSAYSRPTEQTMFESGLRDVIENASRITGQEQA